MKKIAGLLIAIFLLCGFTPAAQVEVKKEDFITLTFPKGITLTVPRSWSLTIARDGAKNTDIQLSEIPKDHAIFNESILLETLGKRNTVVINRKCCSSIAFPYRRGYFTSLHTGYSVSPITPYIIIEPGDKKSSEILKAYDKALFERISRDAYSDNAVISNWSGFYKIKINDFKAISYEYTTHYLDDNSIMKSQVFDFYDVEDSFTILVISFDDIRKRPASGIDKIINSLRIVK